MCVRACGMHVCVCARVRSSDYRQFGTAFWVGLGVCVFQKFSKVSALVHLLSHPPGTAFLGRAWCLRVSCADGDQKFSEIRILVHLLYVVPVENFLRMCGDDHLEYHAVREREGARERVRRTEQEGERRREQREGVPLHPYQGLGFRVQGLGT